MTSLLSLVLRGASQPIQTFAEQSRLRLRRGVVVRRNDCQKQPYRLSAKGKKFGEIAKNSLCEKRVNGALPCWWLSKRAAPASGRKYLPSDSPGRRNSEVSS
jgi:hypothetical protein